MTNPMYYRLAREAREKSASAGVIVVFLNGMGPGGSLSSVVVGVARDEALDMALDEIAGELRVAMNARVEGL